MKVVAEGAEDQPTLERLRSMGCDVVQGYRVARPMPAEELAAWLGAFDAAAFVS
jgi:EAL domain-containing protein (putative c-di-GMP-specific phosphodiesterase class I)